MKKEKFRSLSIIILLTLIVTLSIQVYWNLKNYQVAKEEVRLDIQTALDDAVESYFTSLAKKTFTFFTESDSTISRVDSIIVLNTRKDTPIGLRSSEYQRSFQFITGDSVNEKSDFKAFFKTDSNLQKTIRLEVNDSTTARVRQNFKDLTTRIVLSMSNDSLDISMLKETLDQELSRKNLNIEYTIAVKRTPFFNREISQRENVIIASPKYATGRRTVEMTFDNSSKPIFQRILVSILFSLLVTIVIIWVLFYLYSIIKNQKELSEVKNDLISNITHEFKTPIATVLTAIESIEKFNGENDINKTKKYLKLSSDQLNKLNLMVERLLETASINSENIVLNRQEQELGSLVTEVYEKVKAVNAVKSIHFEKPDYPILRSIDSFHIENAINNLMDNALKYGGSKIELILSEKEGKVQIIVSDNGPEIPKNKQTKIFEKFYRIPTGNIHDVKGFGIGLYYTREIVRKHSGEISLSRENGMNHFKIQF